MHFRSWAPASMMVGVIAIAACQQMSSTAVDSVNSVSAANGISQPSTDYAGSVFGTLWRSVKASPYATGAKPAGKHVIDPLDFNNL
jgi:hypothetical protein